MLGEGDGGAGGCTRQVREVARSNAVSGIRRQAGAASARCRAKGEPGGPSTTQMHMERPDAGGVAWRETS